MKSVRNVGKVWDALEWLSCTRNKVFHKMHESRKSVLKGTKYELKRQLRKATLPGAALVTTSRPPLDQ